MNGWGRVGKTVRIFTVERRRRYGYFKQNNGTALIGNVFGMGADF